MRSYRIPILSFVVSTLAFFNLVLIFPHQAKPSAEPAFPFPLNNSFLSNVLGDNTESGHISIGPSETGSFHRGIITQSILDEPSIDLHTTSDTGSVSIDIYSAKYSQVLDYLRYDSTYRQTQSIDPSALTHINSLSTTISSTATHILLPIDGEGVWFLRLNHQGHESHAFLIRSSIAAIAKEDKNQILIWVSDLITKKTITGTQVEAYFLQDGVSRPTTAKSDGRGYIKLKYGKNVHDVALVSAGNRSALLPLNLRYLNTRGELEKFEPKPKLSGLFVFTDRPVYKPGDTVYFKAVIREDTGQTYFVPAGSAIIKAYSTNDPDSPFYKSTLAINEFGSVSDKFVIPPTKGAGQFHISVRLPDNFTTASDSEGGSSDQNLASFRVEYPKPSEYSLDIISEDAIIVAGEPLDILISGSLTNSQPLSNQGIDYSVSKSDYYEYEFLSQNSQFFDAADYTYGYWDGHPVITSSLLLDSTGRGRINLKTDQSEFKSSVPQVLTLSLAYTDTVGKKVVSRKNFLIYPGEFSIFRHTNLYTGQVNRQFTLPVLVKSHTDLSIKDIKLTAGITRQTWISSPDNPRRYIKEVQELPSLSSTTDQLGKTQFSFTPAHTGTYRFIIKGQDRHGNTISKTMYLWISDISRPAPSGEIYPELKIEPDKHQFELNDQLNLKIWSDIPNRDLLLTLERGHLIRYQLVPVTGQSHTLTLKLEPSDVPNIYVTISGFNDTHLVSDSVNISVAPESKRLKVEINPGSIRYSPGQTATINILTKTSTGNPVGAEVALWVVDKSVFELSRNHVADIYKRFWFIKENRTLSTNSLTDLLDNYSGIDSPENDSRFNETSIYQSTAYWNPNVKTGSDGKGKISFVLPDTLTTWTIAAIATTTDTRVGQATAEITAAKEVAVIPVLPGFFRIGDSLNIPVMIFNSTDSDQTFEAGLSFDSGKVLSDPNLSAITIPPNNFYQINWRVAPETINPVSNLTIIAKSKLGKTDSVIANLPVLPLGYPDTQVQSSTGNTEYQLTIPADARLDLSSVQISLSPDLFGMLPEAMRYVIDYPYSNVESITSRLSVALTANNNLDLYYDALDIRDLANIIQTCIASLASFQTTFGGWGWGTENHPDLYLTDYVLENLQLAKKSGFDVSDSLIGSALDWIRRYSPANPAESALKLHSLGLAGDPDLPLITDFSSLGPVSLAYSAIFNFGHDQNPQTDGLARLISLALSSEDTLYWPADTVSPFPSVASSTALAIKALIAGNGDQSVIKKALQYLLTVRNQSFWSDTHATAQIISAVTPLYKTGSQPDLNNSYTVSVNDKVISSGNITSSTQIIKPISIPISDLKPGDNRIAVSGQGQIYNLLFGRIWRTDKNPAPISKTIGLTRSITNIKGADYPIAVGDTVNVNLTVSGLPPEAKYLIIEDYFPAGLSPITSLIPPPADFSDSSYLNYQNRLFSSSKVIISSQKSDSGNFTYQARVVTEGSFTAPPASVRLAYQPEIFARSGVLSVTTGEGSAILPADQLPGDKSTGSSLMTKVLGYLKYPVIIFILVILLRFVFRRLNRKPPRIPPSTLPPAIPINP